MHAKEVDSLGGTTILGGQTLESNPAIQTLETIILLLTIYTQNPAPDPSRNSGPRGPYTVAMGSLGGLVLGGTTYSMTDLDLHSDIFIHGISFSNNGTCIVQR